jgi:hypothetical protein
MTTSATASAPFAPQWVEQHVPLASIIKHRPWQVRMALDKAAVRRYRERTEAGQVAPPIRLALVRGAFYLVDGWHRLEAGAVTFSELDGGVLAEVATMTEHQAQWEAAKANDDHGVPLKAKEYRAKFGAFIATKQHVTGRGKAMSYRDMSAVIGKPHTTLRGWLQKDHPKVFRAMQGEGGLNVAPGAVSPVGLSLDAERIGQAQEAARTLQQIADILGTAEARGELVAILEETLRVLKAGGAVATVSDF